MVYDEKSIYLNYVFSRKAFYDEELLVEGKALKNWRSAMLTFYNPQEVTIKQINRICHEADGKLRLFFQIAPTIQTLLGESEEMEVLGRVYDNGLLIFDSSQLINQRPSQVELFDPYVSPLEQRQKILHNKFNDSAIIHNRSLIYFIESIDYLDFFKEISKLQLLEKYRAFMYFQSAEVQIIEQLELVKSAVKELKEGGTVTDLIQIEK